VGPNYPNAAALSPYAFAAVSEAEMGADLNADGDLQDDVIHEIQTATDAVRNMGLAVFGRIVTSSVHVASSSARPPGGGRFQRGRPTPATASVRLRPARPFATGTNPLNTGIAAPSTGGGVGTAADSSSRVGGRGARDRNGDGDQIDVVPRVFDGALFAVSALAAPAHAPGTPLVARNGRVLYAASEPAQGGLLNGDGDQLDVALFAIDFKIGLPTLRTIGGGAARAVAGHPTRSRTARPSTSSTRRRRTAST